MLPAEEFGTLLTFCTYFGQIGKASLIRIRDHIKLQQALWSKIIVPDELFRKCYKTLTTNQEKFRFAKHNTLREPKTFLYQMWACGKGCLVQKCKSTLRYWMRWEGRIKNEGNEYSKMTLSYCKAGNHVYQKVMRPEWRYPTKGKECKTTEAFWSQYCSPKCCWTALQWELSQITLQYSMSNIISCFCHNDKRTVTVW